MRTDTIRQVSRLPWRWLVALGGRHVREVESGCELRCGVAQPTLKEVDSKMRRLVMIAALLGAVAGVGATGTPAQGVSPAQLAQAGWSCFLPPPFNPNVHCAPPGQLEGVVSGKAAAATFLAFGTDDLTSESAPFLGTERLIRGDLFHGQPCPTDPPSYQYSWLYPRFGWDYYICHTFDSPW
jgi:hypothetical protein